MLTSTSHMAWEELPELLSFAKWVWWCHRNQNVLRVQSTVEMGQASFPETSGSPVTAVPKGVLAFPWIPYYCLWVLWRLPRDVGVVWGHAIQPVGGLCLPLQYSWSKQRLWMWWDHDRNMIPVHIKMGNRVSILGDTWLLNRMTLQRRVPWSGLTIDPKLCDAGAPSQPWALGG